jgi:hypothetical protein
MAINVYHGIHLYKAISDPDVDLDQSYFKQINVSLQYTCNEKQ